MKEIALEYGFVFKQIGCPCNGSPRIYTQERNGKIYRLTLWEKRQIWKLVSDGYNIATGNEKNMKEKLSSIWD